MKNSVFCSVMVLAFLLTYTATAQTDFFMSTQPLHGGAVNSAANVELNVGDTGSLHVYFDNSVYPDVDTCVWFVLNTSTAGVVNITNFETFEYDIVISGIDIGDRWADSFGPGTVESDGQSARAAAFTVVGGQGMLNSNTGPTFLDEGFDIDSGVFHVARIDFETVGSGNVDFILETDPRVFIGNNGMALDVSYGTAAVVVVDDSILLGDVNLDGFVTLLDVAPLVDRISSGTYQAEADCNEDGQVSLLDVQPFIDAIQFP